MTLARYLALIYAFAACIASCNEEPDGPVAVSRPSLEFTAEGGTETVDITGNNWNAAADVDWIKVTKAEGHITVTVDANEAEEERNGSITVKNADDSQVIAVTQEAVETVDTSLEVDREELSFGDQGGVETVTVTSELEWTAVPDDDWITVEKFEDYFTITLGVNEKEEEIKGEVTVGNGTVTKTVSVKQVAAGAVDPTLTVDPGELSFTVEGGIETVTVASELEWNAVANADWITVDKTDSGVTVTVGTNESVDIRTGSIAVNNGENEKNIAVVQAAAPAPALLEVDPEELNFHSTDDAKVVIVTSEEEWTAVADTDWITVDEIEGGFNVAVSINESFESRSGSIVVNNGETEKTVAVTQGGVIAGLEVDPEKLQFIVQGGSKTVTVASETEWSVSSDSEWLTVVKTGESEFKATAAGNNSGTARVAVVTVTNTNNSKVVNIEQAAPTAIILTPDKLEMGSFSDSQAVTVISETAWTITKSPGSEWLTIVKRGEIMFTVTAASNPGYVRTATITVKNTLGATTTLTVTQYQGEEFSMGGIKYFGADFNYFVTMNSMKYNGLGGVMVGGYALGFDIYSAEPSYDGAFLDITPGTYTVGPSTDAMSVCGPTSQFKQIDDRGNQITTGSISSGTLTVEGSAANYTITFNVTLSNGAQVMGTYRGPLLVENPNAPGIDAGNVSGATVKMSYGGDYFGYGNDMWLLQAYSPTVHTTNNAYSGDGYILISQLSAKPVGDGQYLPDATYVIGEDVDLYPIALKGVISGGRYSGTWLRQLKNNTVVHIQPGITGTITTTRTGNTYTFVLDAVNAKGVDVKGTFTGTADIAPMSAPQSYSPSDFGVLSREVPRSEGKKIYFP